MSRTGAQRIADERDRQVAVENFNRGHDAEHVEGELAAAGACYGYLARLQAMGIPFEMACQTASKGWPFEFKWWKPSLDPLRNLDRAGAFMAAEIDRIQAES